MAGLHGQEGRGLSERETRELKAWARVVDYYDNADNGCGTLELKFRIRDEAEKMAALAALMNREDAKRIAGDYLYMLGEPCEGWFEYWDDIDSGWTLTFGFDKRDREGTIWISASFPT